MSEALAMAFLAAAAAGTPTVTADARAGVVVQLEGRGAVPALADLLKDAREVRVFERLGMLAARVPEGDLELWSAHPRVTRVGPDAEVRGHGEPGLIRTASGAAAAARTRDVGGRGVVIAFLDSGIGPGGLVEPLESVSMIPGTIAHDRSGHGSALAAAAIGESRSRGRAGERAGVAPLARAVSVRVLDADDRGRVSWVLAGVEWLLEHHERLGVRVVNVSLGRPADASYRVDPLCIAMRALRDAGLVVVASAGHDGPVGSPAHAPWVVAAGAVEDGGTLHRSDDAVAAYSSRGPVEHALKPELVAQGRTVDGRLEGTSVSAAVVSGVVALMLEADPSLTPAMARAVLMYTAQPILGTGVFEQGAGLVNAEGAARLARKLADRPDDGPVLVAADRMPDPFSTIAGEIVPWSAGSVVIRRAVTNTHHALERGRLRSVRRVADELVPAGGWLLVDDLLLGPGIVRTEGLLFADGVGFDGDFLFAEGGRAAPAHAKDGRIDVSHVRYFHATVLGRGRLADSSGEVLANDALIAGGLVFTDAPAVGLGIRVRGASRLARDGLSGAVVPLRAARAPEAAGVPDRNTERSGGEAGR